MESELFICDRNFQDIYNYFQTVFLPNCKELLDEHSTVLIGKHFYQKDVIVEEIDLIIRMVQSEWSLLQSVALFDNVVPFNELVYSRVFINKSLFVVKESLQLCDCPLQKERYMQLTLEQLNILSASVIPLNKMDINFMVKLSSIRVDNIKCPVYQYFHTLLDMQYYLLILNYICGASEEKIKNQIENILKNLVTTGRSKFKRQASAAHQIFACPCVKHIWLILQFFMEKTSNDENLFWKTLNDLLNNEDSMFSLCLVKDISSLQSLNGDLVDEGNKCERIKPNFEILQIKLKSLLLSADSDMLIKTFKLIEPLLCNLWQKHAKIEVYQIFWDHYSKRLNISKKNYTDFSSIALNELLGTILWSPKDCDEDFEMFLGLLISHLREYPTHWTKMKGRIYSQLGPNKVKDLSESGIVHVMLLFIALSTVNNEELTKKLVSFLDGLSKENKNKPIIWNLYVAFLFQQVREGKSLEKTAQPLLGMLQESSCDYKLFHLIKDFIANFEHILNFSEQMLLHQWILLNSWLFKYLSSCYYADLIISLEVLLSVLERVDGPDSWHLWEPAFKEYVYPVLKQLSNSQNAPGIIGKISGKLCLLIPQIDSEIFNFFNADSMSPKISSRFLEVVLENYPNSYIMTHQQESIVVQSWVKICLLTKDSCANLTENVLKLDIFPVKLKAHINTSQDPLYAFIEYLGSDIKLHLQSTNITKLCDLSFGHTDKWITQYLLHPENDSVVFRVYTCISLAFLHCGPLLYNRNKSSSPLTKLLQSIVLPVEFLKGQPPHPYVLNAIKKTWHLFFEAIVRLNVDSDLFLERTLKDMITKYIQYFPTADSPILKSLENEITAPVLLEKLTNSYFKHPVKEPDANMLKVLKILSDLVQSTTSLSLMKLIARKILYGLFEVVIFHAQRNAAISFIKIITLSPLYPQIKEEFGNSVVAITEKHLAFNYINYFQLMSILAKFVPTDVRNLLGPIKQNITNVERLRGVGFDKNLRSQFEKLENVLKV